MGKYTFDVPANTEVVRWARVHAKLSIASAIEKSKLARLDEARLGKIEKGEVAATLSEVLEFCRMYKRPFALFFLPEVPAKIPDLPDNRRGTGRGSDTDGKLSMAISRAYEIQNLTIELSSSLGATISEVQTPPAPIKNNPEQLASWMRGQMGIEKVFDHRRRSPREVLERWSAEIEAFGIIVTQETFEPTDSSAFSIGSLKPPILVLCFKDGERRRLFSLFHEVGHILLRQSAICDPSKERFSRSEAEERFCDRFSANFLMPTEEVRELTKNIGGDDLDRLTSQLSSLSGASVESSFLRLIDLRIATFDDYLERKPAWETAYIAWLQKQKSRKGGPNPNPVGTAVRKGGKTLSGFVSDAFQAGQISRADASYIMRLPAREVPNLIKLIK